METSRKRTRFNVPDPSKRRRVRSLNDIHMLIRENEARLLEIKKKKQILQKRIDKRKTEERITKFKGKTDVRQRLKTIVRMDKELKDINELINFFKKYQSTNFDYKPTYISAIKTGTDLLYQNYLNIKKEKLVEIFLSDLDVKKKFDNEEEQEEFLLNNFLKCSLLLIDVDDLGFDIKDDKKKLSSGGGFTFTPSPLIQNFLNYQYIFDNYHDFNDYKEIPDEFFYKSTDIPDAELKKLYGLREPIIFNKIITQSPDILDNILYFSIYNFVNYTKEVDEILGKIMVKNQKDIELMKTNIQQFLKDIMGVKEVNYVVDMKLNFGNLSLLSKFGDKLKSLGVINNISNLLNESSNWELIKKQIIDLFNTKRFYTLEDIYDSAPIKCEENALNFLNDKINDDKSINALGYISYLIFGNEDFTGRLNELQNHKDIFKAFKANIRDIFNVVYYKKDNKYRVALIFKNIDFFSIQGLNKSKFINLKVSSSFPYLYEEDISGDYALDICYNRKIVFEIKNVVQMIKNLDTKKKIKDFGLNDLNNIIASYVAYCIYPHIDKDLTQDIKIKIARAYFDLKKSGDIARILFVFFYNYLKKNNIQYDTMKFITNEICYTGNDKLADLNSIIRKGNNVIFPDTANYSICLFNINNKDYSFKDFYISANIYFISKFIPNKLDIFESLKESNIYSENSEKMFNNIIRNISYDKILFLKDNLDNISNIFNEVKNEIKTDFEKFISSLGYVIGGNIKDFLIKMLKDCETHIKQPLTLISKVDRVSNTDIFEIAKEINLSYIDCHYNHKEMENKLLDKLDKIKIRIRNGENKDSLIPKVNKIKFILFYKKILQYLALLNDITKYDADSFNENLNKNMKYILIHYLMNVKIQIRKNLENEEVITYFNEKVIFNKVEINGINRDIFYNITKRVLKNIKDNNDKIIERFNEIIESIDDKKKDLLDPKNLKELFSTIHNYLKIIDTFIYYIPPIEEDNPNPNNIHECMTNFNKYIFDLLAYKKNFTKQDKFRVNFYTLLEDDRYNILNSIYNFETKSDSGLTSQGANIKSISLIKNFFKNSENINYIMLFNNFYEFFNTIENNNKLLGVDIFPKPQPTTITLINKIISQIKSIYTYSYINIYNSANQKDYFELFFEKIKEVIEERKASILTKLGQQNQEKIDYFKSIIEKLENSIASNKTIFIDLDKKMKGKYNGIDFKEIGYYLNLNDDPREKVQYNYKVKIDIQNRKILFPYIRSIEDEGVNSIAITDEIPVEIKKIIKIFNFFLSFK